MQHMVKKILSQNIVLKAISGIIGFTFWLVASQSYLTTMQYNIPLYFYATRTDQVIKAPEMLLVTLQGKRADLKAIDRATLAIHINAKKLSAGPHQIPLSPETLFLPNHINVVNYIPLNSVITIENTNKKALPALSDSGKPLITIPV